MPKLSGVNTNMVPALQDGTADGEGGSDAEEDDEVSKELRRAQEDQLWLDIA